MKLSRNLLFAATFFSCVFGLDDALGNGLLVNTQQGLVSGSLITPTVRQFLGIPFATAKRWEAPAKPPLHLSVFQANNFSDTCVQSLTPGNLEFLVLTGGQGINIPESENCLSVNIWSPSVSRKQKTAVLLWVYGGAFQFGTSNLPTYNGQNFVRDSEDITVVTFNYRLNIFGQPNAPQLSSNVNSQNFGLLDLEAAISWVHDNIAAFGGDPNRISLFGQSAGSVAIDAYTFSHPDDTIVKGVIEESGNLALVTSGALGSPTLNGTAWNTVASTVGCGSTANAAQLACMKAVPFRTLENAVISTNVLFNLLADNITIFSDTNARAAAGNFLKVPVLGGSTLNEGDIFVVAAELVTSGVALPFITEVLADIMTQTVFTCPAGFTAQERISAQVPTWRYQYQAVFPNISPRPDLRAYHASEIPLVFGTYNASTLAPSTPTEIALSSYVQAAWVAFARNPQQGLLNFGWPMYSPTTPTLAQLGNAANATGVVFTEGVLVDATCGAIPQLLAFSAALESGFA
ncbi:carboxylesterase [Crassisporium funariophilum]|nr:carboxylesterase [Crassisporium funariophilum]